MTALDDGQLPHTGQVPMRQIDALAMPMFDWIMVPVAALSDAFFGMLHMRLPDYVRYDRAADDVFAGLAGERAARVPARRG